MIARHCRNAKIASLFLLLFPCKLILISTASKRIFRFFKADKSPCFQTQKQGQNAANSVIKQAKKRPGTQVGTCVPGLGHGSIFLSFVRGRTENHSVLRIAACAAARRAMGTRNGEQDT